MTPTTSTVDDVVCTPRKFTEDSLVATTPLTIQIATPPTPNTEGLAPPPSPTITRGMDPAFFRLLVACELTTEVVESVRLLGTVGEQVLYRPLQQLAGCLLKLQKAGVTAKDSAWNQVVSLRDALVQNLILHVQTGLVAGETGVATFRLSPSSLSLLQSIENFVERAWNSVEDTQPLQALPWVDDEDIPAPPMSLWQRLQQRSEFPESRTMNALRKDAVRRTTVSMLKAVCQAPIDIVLKTFPQLVGDLQLAWDECTHSGGDSEMPQDAVLSPNVFRRAQAALGDMWNLLSFAGESALFCEAATAGYVVKRGRICHWREVQPRRPNLPTLVEAEEEPETAARDNKRCHIKDNHSSNRKRQRKIHGDTNKAIGILSLMGAKGAPRGNRYISMVATVHKTMRTRQRKKRLAEVQSKEDFFLDEDEVGLNKPDYQLSSDDDADGVILSQGTSHCRSFSNTTGGEHASPKHSSLQGVAL